MDPDPRLIDVAPDEHGRGIARVPTPPSERASILHFLTAQRGAVLAVLHGLSDVDAHRSVVLSGWTPLSMTEHLAGVERYWIASVLGGDPAPTPVRPGVSSTLTAAVSAYVAEIERSDRVLAGLALDDPPAMVPDEMPGEIGTVRDVLLHVIEEVARHAGHLDIARELLDGRTALGPR